MGFFWGARYILIFAFLMGTKGQFDPKILGMTASTAFVALTTEVMLLKLGDYLLPPSSKVPFDLILSKKKIFQQREKKKRKEKERKIGKKVEFALTSS